ncbi:MAG: murein transglycosylase [Kordiimonas sp.]|nr:murein transglycosylase [Kordiimonas sp.]
MEILCRLWAGILFLATAIGMLCVRWLTQVMVGLICLILAVLIWLVILYWPKDVPPLVFTPVTFQSLNGWMAQDHGPSLQALQQSCQPYVKGERDWLEQDPRIGHSWREVCIQGMAVSVDDPVEVREFFEQNFQPYQVTAGHEQTGLLTGYYIPRLRGSFVKTDRYNVPIYKKPENLVTIDLGHFNQDWTGQTLIGQVKDRQVIPYADRTTIEGGFLAGQGQEIMWLDDAIDAFFLHIQGSGLVELPDGEVVRLAYAGRNGHPYFAIGRELIEKEGIAPEQMSMQVIRAWLKAHPAQATELMQKNAAFIFFSVQKEIAAIGTEAVPLTAGRSLAVDRRFYPLGLPLWLESTMPTPLDLQLDGKVQQLDTKKGAVRITTDGGPHCPGDVSPWAQKLSQRDDLMLSCLMITQDTGSAITGALRGDVFFGDNEGAALWAGHMKQPAQFVILIPRIDASGIIARIMEAVPDQDN